jgi:hypothetical protein
VIFLFGWLSFQTSTRTFYENIHAYFKLLGFPVWSKCGNQWHEERHPFESQHRSSFLEFNVPQKGRKGSSHLFIPNVPRHGPPTFSPVQVNLGEILFGFFTGIFPANRVRNATASASVSAKDSPVRPARNAGIAGPRIWTKGRAQNPIKNTMAIAAAICEPPEPFLFMP